MGAVLRDESCVKMLGNAGGVKLWNWMVRRSWVPKIGTLPICSRWIGWRKLRGRFQFGESWRHQRTLADVVFGYERCFRVAEGPFGRDNDRRIGDWNTLASRRDPAQGGMPRSWRSGHVLGQTLDVYAGRRASEPIANSFPILRRERGILLSLHVQCQERRRRTIRESSSPRPQSAGGVDGPG